MRKFILLLLFLPIFICVKSQSINNDPYQNRIIQSYYTKADLTAAQSQDFKKYKWIKYYYIHSFILESNFASTCTGVTPDMVDVTDYEQYRLPNRRVTFKDENCNFVITLLSQRELDLLIFYDGILPAPNTNTTDR